MRIVAAALALALPAAAGATCWSQPPVCEASLRHADCTAAEGPWPASQRLTVTGSCVVGGCAAGPDNTSSTPGDPPVLRRVDGAELTGVPGTFTRIAPSTCDLLTFDHDLVPGHYRYGPLDFDVVGDPPPSAAVAWPRDLPFQPDGIRVPVGSDEGQTTIDVPVPGNDDGSGANALTRLRRAAVDAGFVVMTEDAAHLELAHNGDWIEVTLTADHASTAVLDVRWQHPTTDPMWFTLPDACGPNANLTFSPVLDRPADVRVEAACLRDGVRDGPFAALGPGIAYERGAYAAGIKVGPWVTVEANGARTDRTYIAGHPEGHWVRYYADRGPDEAGDYVNGAKSGAWERYWPDHTLRERSSWCDGAPCGDRIAWYPRLSPASVDLTEIGYQGHPGPFVLPASPGGQIFEQARFIDGLLDGPYERYLPSTAADGTFVKMSGRYDAGKPDGKWWTRDASGAWEKLDTYKDGVRNGVSAEWYGGVLTDRHVWKGGAEVSVWTRSDDAPDSKP